MLRILSLLLFASVVIASGASHQISEITKIENTGSDLEEPANNWHRYATLENGLKVHLTREQSLVKLGLVHNDHVPIPMVDHFFINTRENLHSEEGLNVLQNNARMEWNKQYKEALAKQKAKAKKAREASVSIKKEPGEARSH